MPTGNMSMETLHKPRYKSSIYYLLLFAIIVVFAYWPISFHVLSLKNDALNYFLPVRHLVSESYSQGMLPLWTPYLNLGYPLHGDMQSGVWNPIVQFISLFGPYNLYTLQIETLLYVYLSGVGMFYLLKYFNVDSRANILASVAYMLCGFNSDSAQFLNWIASTAFLPFVFLFYYRCLYESSLKQGVYAGTALFFLFTCAYPADFILTAYLLLALQVVFIVSASRRKIVFSLRSFLLSHLLLLLIFIILCSPAILSYMESLPLQERGTGANYADAMSNPLHPAMTITFTHPLGAWKMPGMEINDPLTRNSYIGVSAFLLMIISFLTRAQDPVSRFSKWAALTFAIFSFGEFGGLRILSYYVLPLMDSFRHPSNARMFTLFFACLLAAFTYHQVLQNGISLKKLKTGWMVGMVIFGLITIIAFFFPLSFFSAVSLRSFFDFPSAGGILPHLKTHLESITFGDMLLFNTIIQLPFLFLVYRYLVKNRRPFAFVTISILNGMLFTMMFQPFTVVKKDTAGYIQSVVDHVKVDGYPIPDIKKSLEENSADNEKYKPEIGCQNLYNKRIGRSEYRITPCNLLSQNRFWFDTSFRTEIMKYPLFYRADKVADFLHWKAALQDSGYHWAFTEGLADIHTYPGGDSAKFEITSFSPGRITGSIIEPRGAEYVLMQNHYPRWELFIDGKRASIEMMNLSFMGFRVPKGKHEFEFRYTSNDLRITWIISLVTLGLVFLIAFFFNAKRKNPTP